jgi:hypothetical protein
MEASGSSDRILILIGGNLKRRPLKVFDYSLRLALENAENYEKSKPRNFLSNITRQLIYIYEPARKETVMS